MELDPYISELSENLIAAAAAGDDSTRQTAALLAAALAPSARLALMNALSDLAADVTAALDGPSVELRLDGRDVTLVVTGAGWSEDAEPTTESPPPASADPGGETSRITLRLPEGLKNRAESAAARQGVSLNNWLTGAVESSLTQGQKPQHQGGGRRSARITGWVTG